MKGDSASPSPSKKRRKPEGALACPSCGSDRVVEIEGEFPSGVVSPDGVGETLLQKGLKCLKCGGVEEI